MHLADQAGQILGGGRQEAPGQKDLPGEAVAQDPEDLVTDVGLQSVDGQDDTALIAQQWLQALGVGTGQRPEFVIAVQEVGDRALSDDQPAAGQLAVDLGDAAVLGMSEPTDCGHDIESELVIGQGEVGLGLGPVGPEEAGTSGIVTASDSQCEAEDAVEGRDGAEVVVAGPEPVLTLGAVAGDGNQAQGAIGLGRGRRRLRMGASFGGYLPSTKPASVKFATLVFFRAAVLDRTSQAPRADDPVRRDGRSCGLSPLRPATGSHQTGSSHRQGASERVRSDPGLISPGRDRSFSAGASRTASAGM